MVFGWFPWFFKVVSWFLAGFHGSGWVFMVPSWFFMVSGWFLWFFVVPVRFSWFFMVPGWFFMVPGRFFMVPDHFSWFQVGFHGFHGSRLVLHGFSWFFSKMYLPELYPGPMIQSRSAARRAA